MAPVQLQLSDLNLIQNENYFLETESQNLRSAIGASILSLVYCRESFKIIVSLIGMNR